LSGEPWENEPDRLEADYKGLKLLILRNERLGHLCGYVGVPEGHPFYGKDLEQLADLDVHGGVTFTEEGDGKLRPKGFWWIGFDCAHFGDLVPKMRSLGWEVYRDIYYVLKETVKLADQIIGRM